MTVRSCATPGCAAEPRIIRLQSRAESRTLVWATLLADALGLKTHQITLLSGQSQPRKVVRIDGLDEPQIQTRPGIVE